MLLNKRCMICISTNIKCILTYDKSRSGRNRRWNMHHLSDCSNHMLHICQIQDTLWNLGEDILVIICPCLNVCLLDKKSIQIIIGSLVCVASQSLAPCNVLMLGVRNAKITDCGCELSNYKQWMWRKFWAIRHNEGHSQNSRTGIRNTRMLSHF